MVKHGVHRTLWNEWAWRSVRPLRARGLAFLTYHRVGCQRPFSPGIPVDGTATPFCRNWMDR